MTEIITILVLIYILGILLVFVWVEDEPLLFDIGPFQRLAIAAVMAAMWPLIVIGWVGELLYRKFTAK